MTDFESIKQEILEKIKTTFAIVAGVNLSQNTERSIERSLDKEKKHLNALRFVREQREIYEQTVCVSSPLNKYMKDYMQTDFQQWESNISALATLCFLEAILTSPLCDDHAIEVSDYTIKKLFDRTYDIDTKLSKLKATGEWEK